jgi:hypothetical protein
MVESEFGGKLLPVEKKIWTVHNIFYVEAPAGDTMPVRAFRFYNNPDGAATGPDADGTR